MTAIRNQGKINDNTTLIDFGFEGIARSGGVYLVEAGKTCLIDSGSKEGASRIIRVLKEIDAFPPDYVILTHSHYDHCQGVPILRKKAGKEIRIMASDRAIPLLEDQSWNKVFPKRNFENIKDVIPLKEGEKIDLGGLSLTILDVPGHCKDHIAIIDEKNQNIFVGDAVGSKTGDNVFMAPIIPPFWNKEDYYASLDKLKQIDNRSISLAHYGYIYGDEAENILDEARKACEQTWRIFETAEKEGKLDDPEWISEAIMRVLQPVFPEINMEKFLLKLLFGLVVFFRRITLQKPFDIADYLLKIQVKTMTKGYKMYKKLG